MCVCMCVCLYVCLYVCVSVCLSVFANYRHTAVLAPSSREISQSVRIECHLFLSRVRILVRHSKLFIGENPKYGGQKNEYSVDRQRRVETAKTRTARTAVI